MAALCLHCCVWAFSSCGKRELLLCCGSWASHCGGFSCCRARALGLRASVVVAHRLSSCSTWTQLLRGMWDLPAPGIEPVSPALAGGFLTTAPPGKSSRLLQFARWKITPLILMYHVTIECFKVCTHLPSWVSLFFSRAVWFPVLVSSSLFLKLYCAL